MVPPSTTTPRLLSTLTRCTILSPSVRGVTTRPPSSSARAIVRVAAALRVLALALELVSSIPVMLPKAGPAGCRFLVEGRTFAHERPQEAHQAHSPTRSR